MYLRAWTFRFFPYTQVIKGEVISPAFYRRVRRIGQPARVNGTTNIMKSQGSFTLVFAAVLAITILSLIVSFFTAWSLPNTSAASALNEATLSVFKLGCGAIIGLLGGRALGSG